MLSSIILIAAEHSEPSKTPFYIAGGALVIWAGVISYLGITKDSFASTKSAGLAVAVVSASLVALTMAMSVVTG